VASGWRVSLNVAYREEFWDAEGVRKSSRKPSGAFCASNPEKQTLTVFTRCGVQTDPSLQQLKV
jgi:hypothetical protein